MSMMGDFVGVRWWEYLYGLYSHGDQGSPLLLLQKMRQDFFYYQHKFPGSITHLITNSDTFGNTST